MESEETNLSRHQIWYRKNKQKAYESSRKWKEKNKERMREYYRKYYKENAEQYRETERRRYKKHREKRLASERERTKKYRNMILEAYGKKCKCCNENRIEFLAIDHVNGGGYKERKALGIKRVYAKIIKENYPDNYRLLCHNCNQSLGFYGYCPHNKEFK